MAVSVSIPTNCIVPAFPECADCIQSILECADFECLGIRPCVIVGGNRYPPLVSWCRFVDADAFGRATTSWRAIASTHQTPGTANLVASRIAFNEVNAVIEQDVAVVVGS